MFRKIEQKYKKIFMVLTIGLAAVCFWLYCYDYVQQEQQRAALERAIQKARPYEKELRELKKSLSEQENNIEYVSDQASIMVGFLVSDEGDIPYIEEKAEEYGFRPVIVVDCTSDMENILACVEVLDPEWEVMLYAPEFSSEIHEDVVSVKKTLQSFGRKDTGLFFLRNGYDTEPNLQLIAQSGFVGYTLYHDSPISGQTEDGYVYFDYSYIRTDNTAISDRLSQCYSAKTSFLLTLDMKSIHSEALPEKTVTEILDQTQALSMQEDCSFATVDEVVSELSKINRKKAKKQKEYEEQIFAAEERMEELERMIDEIYSAWDADEVGSDTP